jgi:hypothetical protein
MFSGTSNNSTNFAGQPQSFYANVSAPLINTITVGNSTVNAVINATNYAGIANNSTNFSGQPQAFYANVSAPSFTTNISVGANVKVNTSVFVVGNTTVSTFVNSSFISTTNVFATGNSGFNANLSVGGTLTVAGNLVVTGSLTYTSVAAGNFIPEANGQLLGNTTGWWDAYLGTCVILADTQANTATFAGLVNATSLNVNGAINASGNTTSNNMLVTGTFVTGSSGETNERSFTTTTQGLTPQIIDTFTGASFRTGKYFFYVMDQNNNNYYISESMILFDGTNVLQNEFGAITSNSVLGAFNANASAGVVRIWFTPTVANTQIRVNRCLFIT